MSNSNKDQHTNRLIKESSPYLLQHAHNPVDWFPWGSQALEKARTEDKPIFLSIGYAACHWCHVMAHESFEDKDTAAFMNEHFVNIKVDREERPDLDGIYMSAVVAFTGQGGWPMSVFLTPEGVPFYGGTYFPPTRRFNMPAFEDVLAGVANAWQTDRARVLESGRQITLHLQTGLPQPGSAEPLTAKTLDQAALALAQDYDWTHGGWGRAPKFPQPMTIKFLLARASRGDSVALEIASHTLDSMAKGGMYDVVGGGFARYSVDDHWRVPHFEKMLYDNAQLALAYLYGYLLTGKPAYRRVCEETLDFVARELTHPLGGFYSSLDADSEGEEGKYHVWNLAQIEAALKDEADIAFLTAAYAISPTGNFEGHTILQRALDDAALAARFGVAESEVVGRLSKLHARLREARETRVRPATDDKVLTGWSALMLLVFSEAGRYLENSRYVNLAMRNAAFILEALHPQDRLLRAWRDAEPPAPKARHNAYLEDYAALTLSLLSLYQTDPDPRWFAAAQRFARDILTHFTDPQGGFFDTRLDHEPLLLRPKDLQDNATPSGSALAATALLQLAAFTGEDEYRAAAETALQAVQPFLARYPTAFAQWLCAADFALSPTQEIALLTPPDEPVPPPFTRALWRTYRPHLVAAISPFPPPEGAPPLLAHRPLLAGKTTAYVCEGFVCQQPVDTPEAFAAQVG